MLENEVELKHSIRALAKQYNMVEQIAASTLGYADTREAEIMGVQAVILQIEREVAVYLATKHGITGASANLTEQEAERQHEFVPLKKAA